MGTSGSNQGTGGSGTPLIPDWLNSQEVAFDSSPVQTVPQSEEQVDITGFIQPQEAQPISADPRRYTEARSNFSRFAKSGGSDTGSLRRAVSGYVRNSSGGSRQAARRMGSSRTTAAKLLGFLTESAQNGIGPTLKSLHLEDLQGRPLNQIFIGLSEYICPVGGTVDAGIARDAFIETITNLTESGITDLNSLNIEQVQTILELYLTHTIEAKIYNEIGINAHFKSFSPEQAEIVQTQVKDFIQNGVSDSLNESKATLQTLTQDRMLDFVDRIYTRAFELLSILSDEGSAK